METQSILFLSPIGNLQICGTENSIKSICFFDGDINTSASNNTVYPILTVCKNQLNEYFAGNRKSFSLRLAPDGTSFQKQVWKVLADIPFGKTISYGELAHKLGDKNLMRAVGGANGKNPIAIVIPCHRVIGTSGTLTGYAGGLWRKKWLLDLEKPEKQTLLF